MELLERYELIFFQALNELNPPALSESAPELARQHGELAPPLGDILYRLAIEHGVPYNQFRRDSIELLVLQKPVTAPAGKRAAKKSAPEFAAAVQKYHPLLLLALETMPPDSEI